MTTLYLIYILLHLVANLYKSPYFWGVDAWAYFNITIAFVFSIGLILLLIPKINNAVTNIIEKNAKKIKNIKLLDLYIVVFFVFIMYILHQNTFFLGDGYLRLRNTETNYLYSEAQPLDTLIHTGIYNLLNNSFKISSQQVFLYISLICAAFSMFFCIFYSKKLFTKKEHYWFPVAILFSSASVQLFAGYVESYTISTTFLIIYLFNTLYNIKNNKYSYLPIILLSLSIACHPLGIIFIPSLLYYYYIVIKADRVHLIVRISVLFLIPFLIALSLFFIFTNGGVSLAQIFDGINKSASILPLFSNEQSVGILSLGHLIDISNQILLVFPAIILLFFILKNFKNEYYDKYIKFLSISVIMSLLLLIIFKTDLGYSRDWDILSVISFPMGLLFSYLVIKINKDFKRIALLIISLSVIHTLSWLYINHNEEIGLQRASIIAQTPHWSNSAKAKFNDELSVYYYRKGDLAKSTEMLENANSYVKNERYKYSLAVLYYKTNQIDKALELYNELRPTNFYKALVLASLGEIHYSKGNYYSAIDAMTELVNFDTNDLNAKYNLSLSYIKLNKFSEAIELLNKIIDIDKYNYRALNTLAELYFNLRLNKEAINIYYKLSNIEQQNPIFYYNTAVCQAEIGDYNNALKNIQVAIQLGYDKTLTKALYEEIIKNIRK